VTVIIWKESRRRLADDRQWACAAAAPLLAAWGKALTEATPAEILDLPAEHKFLDHFERCAECQVNARYWARYGRRNPAAGN
jgi:hypothetical protein